jgi:hypothetical protein
MLSGLLMRRTQCLCAFARSAVVSAQCHRLRFALVYRRLAISALPGL